MKCMGIITKIFPILMTDTISEAQSSENIHTHGSRNTTMFKLLETKLQRRNLEGRQRKDTLLIEKQMLSITADFSTEAKRPEAMG